MRCFQPPDSSPASWFARLVRPRSASGLAYDVAAVWDVVNAGDEVEVLGDGEVIPEGKSLRHVADVALDVCALRANVIAEAGAGAGIGT